MIKSSQFLYSNIFSAMVFAAQPQGFILPTELSAAQIDIDEEEAFCQKEKFGSMVSLTEALRLATDLIMNDFRHPEAPMSLALDLADTENDELRFEHAQEILLTHLKSDATFFALIKEVPDNKNIYRPEHGESIEDNWLFFMRLESLSDHLYWIVIPRQKPSAGYVYGFN